MQTRAIGQKLKKLTKEANRHLCDLEKMGQDLEAKLTAALEKAWLIGRALIECKRLVGHGNFMAWLSANVRVCYRQSRRYMELAEANPTAQRVEDLSPESVRKFRLRYVPEKDHPQLEGDIKLPRVCHHLTLLNDWRRWQRRVELGEANLDKEEAKRDLAPLARWLFDLYGVPASLPDQAQPPL